MSHECGNGRKPDGGIATFLKHAVSLAINTWEWQEARWRDCNQDNMGSLPCLPLMWEWQEARWRDCNSTIPAMTEEKLEVGMEGSPMAGLQLEKRLGIIEHRLVGMAGSPMAGLQHRCPC